MFSLHMKVTIITSAPWKSEVRGVCALNVTLVSVGQEINTTGFCLVMHAWITIYYLRNREKYLVDVNIEENMQIEESIKFSNIFKINERSLK